MQNLETAFIQCPYCWEQIEVVVDCSIEQQEYIEDCSICCRPIVISVVISQGEIASIEARSEDE
ncbi:MAG: CPXCG motif-containing cysteine-rich protein [Pseudomonadota bacterium]